ncbi:hypothetical protein Pan241w_37840 [Gimesia alba]|uniref:Uncharacterized protein n=1 Tax=Gimesia alba TaxID=2527973 RepID=A0A517RII6_9PLAN|nr:hypothetical protein [Gimesia alba]QDT43682.1 hypothetical protein Pan241w_37840 [Gimesia alba]
MAEKYFVECDCGKRVRVALHEAGTDKACHSCHRSVRVPDTITLQESSGDKYPLLRPLEKVMVTLRKGEPPFDGLCHHCETRDANFLIPVRLHILVERFMKHDGGFRPTLHGGVKLVAAAAEEFWKEIHFPLLLCAECHKEFEADQSRASHKRAWELAGLFALLIAFLVFAFFFTVIIAMLSFFFWLLGAIAWAAQFRDRKKLKPYLISWLEDIRWVPEALAVEDEYNLDIDESIDLRRAIFIVDESESSPTSPVIWWQQQSESSYFEIP